MIGARSAVGRVFGLAAAAALVLGGCAAIPTSGPVERGRSGNVTEDDVLPVPPEIPENDPVLLVDGFLKATAAGVSNDFADLRNYLVGSVNLDWDPGATVLVYGTGDFTPDWDGDDEAGTVTYSFPVAATVDASGRMTEVPAGTRRTVTFEVSQVVDGRWRISGLDDGIILSEANFKLVYRPVVLAFASRDLQVVVPDLRWLPRKNAATHAAVALAGGPSPWLADAVETGLTPTAKLAVDAVPVEDGVATVSLAAGSVETVAGRALASEQFDRTLEGLPDVADVEVTVAGLPLGGDGSVSLAASPVPAARAVAIVDGRVAVWDSGTLGVASSAGVLPADAADIALSYDGATVAVLVGGSAVETTSVPTDLVAPDAVVDDAPAPMTVAVTGWDLVAPSFDRLGWLWTAEKSGSGSLTAVSPEGERIDVSIEGFAGREIGAISVARDGARVAVVSREGGLWRLEIVPIVRSAEGVPISAGVPLDAGVGVGPSHAIAWIDDNVVAMLGTSAEGETPSIRIVTVGGRTEVVAGVPDAVGFAARSGTGSIVLVVRDGSLYARSNIAWSLVSTAGPISDLAYAG